MKSSFGISINQSYSFILLIAVTAFFSACSTKYAFNTSAVVPAAVGSVKVKKDNNNNYNIDLQVDRLADPKRLTPAKEVYVVWMDTQENGQKNIGQLKTSSGIFSDALKSTLKTVTPFKPTSFYITAENEADIQYPSGVEVMRTSVNL